MSMLRWVYNRGAINSGYLTLLSNNTTYPNGNLAVNRKQAPTQQTTLTQHTQPNMDQMTKNNKEAMI